MKRTSMIGFISIALTILRFPCGAADSSFSGVSPGNRNRPGLSFEYVPSVKGGTPGVSYGNETTRIVIPMSTNIGVFGVDTGLKHSYLDYRGSSLALWNVGLGASFVYRFPSGGRVGASISVSSKTDAPFRDVNLVSPSFGLTSKFPVRDRDSISLGISFIPARDIFAIPHVAYEWRPLDSLLVSAGVPLSVSWSSRTGFGAMLSYVPPKDAFAETWFVPVGLPVTFFARWENGRDSWTLAALLPDRHQISYEYQKVSGGARFAAGRIGSFELRGGLSYRRSVSIKTGIGRESDFPASAFFIGAGWTFAARASNQKP